MHINVQKGKCILRWIVYVLVDFFDAMENG